MTLVGFTLVLMSLVAESYLTIVLDLLATVVWSLLVKGVTDMPVMAQDSANGRFRMTSLVSEDRFGGQTLSASLGCLLWHGCTLSSVSRVRAKLYLLGASLLSVQHLLYLLF